MHTRYAHVIHMWHRSWLISAHSYSRTVWVLHLMCVCSIIPLRVCSIARYTHMCTSSSIMQHKHIRCMTHIVREHEWVTNQYCMVYSFEASVVTHEFIFMSYMGHMSDVCVQYCIVYSHVASFVTRSYYEPCGSYIWCVCGMHGKLIGGVGRDAFIFTNFMSHTSDVCVWCCMAYSYVASFVTLECSFIFTNYVSDTSDVCV